jgi:hypothetical protein
VETQTTLEDAILLKIADLEDNMDLRRLPAIGEKDLERLRRYRRAWAELKALEQGDPPSPDAAHSGDS